MTAGGFPHSEILGSKPGWRLPEAYRSLQRPSSVLSAKASTPRPCRQPIHPYGTRKTPYRQIPRRQIITSEMITKRSTNNNKQNIQMKFDRKTIEAKRRPTASASLASTIQFSNHHAPHAHAHPQEGRAHHAWATNRTTGKTRGVAVREPKSMPIPCKPHDLFHTSTRDTARPSRRRGTHCPKTRTAISVERR